MKSTARYLLERAEAQLREGKHREAYETLAELDKALLSGEPRAHYCLLMGEACFHLGDYEQTYLDEAIAYYRPSADNLKYARAKFFRGHQLRALGLQLEAREAFTQAYAASVRSEDTVWMARALNMLASVDHSLGYMDQAISHLEKCIALKESRNHRPGVAVGRFNLALVYFRGGLISKSLETYRMVLHENSLPEVKNRIACQLGFAMVTAISGDSKLALNIIADLERDVRGYKREQAILHEFKGWTYILCRRYAEAKSELDAGLRLALEIAPESDLVSQIKRLFGDLYVATGEFDLARQYAAEALEVADKLNERVEIAACRRVFAQVEQHRGNDKAACDWYGQAIDLFNQIGSRYELAVTRYLAGSSGLYGNGERAALLYLAREYFESENIRDYITRIDRELNCSPAVIRRRSDQTVPRVVAVNPTMKKIVALADNVACSDMTVFLTGATGTGKDFLAHYIHHVSGRQGPFVVVNAAAIPNSMIEAELFGHRKGAFTGADQNRAGLFEQACEGTFYLNEIADASTGFQAKLLEVLERRKVRRLGENRMRDVSFRLIAATNHDLKACLKNRSFRLDLYHRLNEIPIHLPPLEERSEDIPELVRHFLSRQGLDVNMNGTGHLVLRLADFLSRRKWPGNVRELEATVNRLWLESKHDLSSMIVLALRDETDPKRGELFRVLERTGWNRSETARVLGVSEGAVRKRIRKYGLSPM